MTIDKVAVQNQTNLNAPVREASNEQPPLPDQKDSVKLGSEESFGHKVLTFPGKVLRVAGGAVMGTADAVLGIAPSTLGGVTSALSVRPGDPSGQYGPYKGDADGGYIVGYILQAGAAGAVAGGFLGGPWGVALGGVGGLIAGGIKMGIDHSTGVIKRITGKIEEATFEPILDNTPSGDKMYDAGKNISEGGILGAKAGVAENFVTGYEKAGGTISGLWEGTKGFAKTMVHSEPEAPAPAPENQTFGQQVKEAAKFVLSLPKNIVKVAVGLAGGVIGAAMNLPDGLIEGVAQGAHHHGDADRISMSKSGHRFLIRLESALIGGAAGAFAGPIGMIGGAIAGGLGGLVVGLILTRIEKSTGTDKRIVENMENHMKREIADNKDLGSKIANGHRDVIEGALVGTGAGIKEGFSVGYDAGAGFVQGVADGVVGVAKGLKGAFKAISTPQTPKPQVDKEE